MMKNAFYFCPDFFCHVWKRLDKKARLMLISQFMTPQPGKQIITIYILANISRSKDDQTLKFVQLIKYNVRNMFLINSYRKLGRETISRPIFVF